MYFYFRARGEHWRVEIAKTKKHWEKNVIIFSYLEPYGNDPFEAGWMPDTEAKFFIVLSAFKYRHRNKEQELS